MHILAESQDKLEKAGQMGWNQSVLLIDDTDTDVDDRCEIILAHKHLECRAERLEECPGLLVRLVPRRALRDIEVADGTL